MFGPKFSFAIGQYIGFIYLCFLLSRQAHKQYCDIKVGANLVKHNKTIMALTLPLFTWVNVAIYYFQYCLQKYRIKGL